MNRESSEGQRKQEQTKVKRNNKTNYVLLFRHQSLNELQTPLGRNFRGAGDKQRVSGQRKEIAWKNRNQVHRHNMLHR